MMKDIDLAMSKSLSLNRQTDRQADRQTDRQTGGLYLEPSTLTGREVTDI